MTDYQNIKKWEHPKDYFGETWYDYYVFLGRHRDSDLLTESNFAEGLKALGGESETVVVVCNNHWAVGWIEFIAIHESDTEALKQADEILGALSDYPILNETDYSEREFNAANDAWDNMSMRERIRIAVEQGKASCFAARRSFWDWDDTGAVRDYLVGN